MSKKKCSMAEVSDVQYITLKNENLDDRLQGCTKKSYHNRYIGIDEFFANPWKHFPRTWRLFTKDYKSIEELPNLLKSMGQLTCHIHVKFKDNSSTGSGFIQRIRRLNSGRCTCHECNGDVIRSFAIVTVTTVVHVFDKNPKKSRKIFITEWNSKSTTVKLFYDSKSDDLKSLPVLDGYRMLETDKEIDLVSDWCAIECVTHDMELVNQLETDLNNYMDMQAKVYRKFSDLDRRDHVVIIIGHPHGGPKKISIGTFDPKNTEILKDVRNYQRWCRYNYDVLTCEGSSGSPVFIIGQPLCGFGYWFGHPHNHSKGFEAIVKGYSSIGVEHLSENEETYSSSLSRNIFKLLIFVSLLTAVGFVYFNK
ncbi:hypothetical protein Btru_002492 [Bulinus truncatus]|nr:hypothetical protein Btru_002492 [Bulinus truncatus]